MPLSTVSARRAKTTAAYTVGRTEVAEGATFKRRESREAVLAPHPYQKSVKAYSLPNPELTNTLFSSATNRALSSQLFTKKGDTIYGTTTDEFLGSAIATNKNGDRMVVSTFSPKQVKVFKYEEEKWSQLGSNTIQNNYAPVAINDAGDRIIIGGGYRVLHARVYELMETSGGEEYWGQLGSDINNSIVGAVYGLGNAVCMNGGGNRVLVLDGSSFWNRHDLAGPNLEGLLKAHVLEYDGSNWNVIGGSINLNDGKTKKLITAAMNSAGDRVILGDPYFAFSGSSADGNQYPRGRVHVYELSGSSWSNLATIEGKPDTWGNDNFGNDVQMNSVGDIIAAGAPVFGYGTNSNGTFRAYRISPGGNSQQLGSDMSFPNLGYWGRISLNGAGDRLVADGSVSGGYPSIYEVHVYDYKDSGWEKVWVLDPWPVSPAANGGDATTQFIQPRNIMINKKGDKVFVAFHLDSTGAKGAGAIHMYTEPLPTSSPTSNPITSPSYKPTSGPTTAFEYQNFTIGILQSSFVNDPIDGFTISLNYEPLGHSIKNLSLSLHYSNCTTPISDQVVALKDNTLVSGERTLLIDTGKFSSSDHVVNSDLDKNESVGVLGFCVRAEGFDSVTGGTSVSFRQDEIHIFYDLSSNSFSVIDNAIIADEIETSENNITSTYEVEAFRCTDGFTRDDIVKVLAQNDIVYICVRPVNLTVHIGDFEMYFWQDDENKYEAVSYGENVNPLSQLSTKDKTKRVASRIISRFFNEDANDFVVKGNVYLSFDTSRERQLRSIQEPDQTAEATYSMKVELEKKVFQKNSEESDIYEFVGFVAIGTLVFSIIILAYKKIKIQFRTRN